MTILMTHATETAMSTALPRGGPRIAASWADPAIFIAGALLLAAATQIAIPALVAAGWQPLLAWFAAGAALVFAPIAGLGWLVVRAEGGPIDRERLRLRPMSRRDWAWVGAGLAVIGAAGGGIAYVIKGVLGAPLHPSFMAVEPLTPDRLWILGAWLPFWLLNVLGEEFTWRAVILPRQEAQLGRRAWLWHALLWTLFHIPFGPAVLACALPILLVVPYVAQRTGNTWTAVALHGLSNGPAFVLIALGVI